MQMRGTARATLLIEFVPPSTPNIGGAVLKKYERRSKWVPRSQAMADMEAPRLATTHTANSSRGRGDTKLRGTGGVEVCQAQSGSHSSGSTTEIPSSCTSVPKSAV